MSLFEQEGGVIELGSDPNIELRGNNQSPGIDPFSNIDEIQKSRGIKTLVYGRPATAKTHFSLTGIPPLYVIDSERAVTLLRDKFPEKKIFVLEAYESKPEEADR